MVPKPEDEQRKTTTTSLQVIDGVNTLDGASLSEIAEYMKMSTSTLYTHLKTLENNGYIIKDNGGYGLGLKLFHLGEESRYSDSRYSIAKMKAAELADRVNEEVNFVVEQCGRMIVLFSEIGDQSVEGYQAGQYFHMHSSAAGKVHLAEFSGSRRADILDEWGLPKETENTITDREELLRTLEQVQEQGYAVSKQEAMEGLQAVAVPVMDPTGGIFGTLDISGPPYRLPDSEELAKILKSVARELEAEIE